MLKAAAASLAVFGASVAWLMGGMFTAESAHAEGPFGGGLLSGSGAEQGGLGELLDGATGTIAEVTNTVVAPAPPTPASAEAAPPPAAIANVADSVLDSLVESPPASEPEAPAPLLDLDLTPITDALGPATEQAGATPAPVIAPVAEPVAALLDSVTPVVSPALQPVAEIAGPTLLTLAPVTGDLASPLGPVVDPLGPALAPITGPLGLVLAPVTGPLGTVLAPVTGPLVTVLAPVVDPLAPVLAPVTGPLAPVLGPITGPLNPVITPITPVIPAAQPPITGPAVPPPSPGQPNTPAKPAKPSDKPAAAAPGVPAVYVPDSSTPGITQPRVPALSEPNLVRDSFIDLADRAAAEVNSTLVTPVSPASLRLGGTAAESPEAPRQGSFSMDAPASAGPFAPAFLASASNALAISSTSAGFFAALAATLAAGALLAVWRRVGTEWLVPPSLSFAPEVPPA